jgi:hypothetical protein
VQSQPRQIVHKTPSPKITIVKCAGGVAQAVECIFCKCKALSSNPSSTHTPPRVIFLPNNITSPDSEGKVMDVSFGVYHGTH